MKRNTRYISKLSASCGALVLGLMGTVAHAEAVDASAEQDNGGIAEIIVTAQRSEAKLQDTPLSIVAVGGPELERQGTDSLSGFDSFIPNVTIGGTAAQGNAIVNVAIRGIGGAPQGFITQEGSVGIYVDDILFARPNGALLELLDVERVEVLRGPQGTLFGRNTAGGAIRYVTKQPADKLQGAIKVVAGSRDRFDISGMLNVPLGDTVAARFSFAKKSRDGFIRKIIDNTYVGGGDSTTMRGQISWKPTDRLEVNVSGDLIRTSDNGQPSLSTDFSATDLYPSRLYSGSPSAAVLALRNTAPASVSPSNYGNAATDFASYYGQITGKYEIYGGLTPDVNKFKSYGLTGTIAYELTDNLSVKSLTGYRDIGQIQNQDWDRTPIPLVQLNDTTDIAYFTQELQLNGSFFNDKLKMVAGAFYYWDDSLNTRRRFDPSSGANSAYKGDTGKGAFESKHIKTEAIALFTQGTLAITDALSATAGVRWGEDKKDFTSFREGRGKGLDGIPAPRSVSGKWSSVSPRFSLDYRWSPEVMTYVSVAKGYKGGGFNDGIQPECATAALANCGLSEYLPENLWTYEAGVRTDLFDRRVRLNVTAFLTKYKDQQIQLADPGPPPLVYTVNGDSTVKGFEAEFLASPIENLMLKASLGYVDAGYDEEIKGVAGAVAITPAVPFYRSPKWSYTLGASYSTPVSEAGEVALDVNWGWKDKQVSYPSPTNYIVQPSYGLLNGRISFNAAAGWSLAVFGNNITNKYYLTGGFDPSGPANKPVPGLTGVAHDAVFGFTMLDVGRPREVGVELSYKF